MLNFTYPFNTYEMLCSCYCFVIINSFQAHNNTLNKILLLFYFSFTKTPREKDIKNLDLCHIACIAEGKFQTKVIQFQNGTLQHYTKGCVTIWIKETSRVKIHKETQQSNAVDRQYHFKIALLISITPLHHPAPCPAHIQTIYLSHRFSLSQ